MWLPAAFICAGPDRCVTVLWACRAAAAEYEAELQKVLRLAQKAPGGKKKGPDTKAEPPAAIKAKALAAKPINPLPANKMTSSIDEQQRSSDWRKYIPPVLPVNPLGQITPPTRQPIRAAPVRDGAPRPSVPLAGAGRRPTPLAAVRRPQRACARGP